ncbi:unnamed protein product [Arctia plantaginis]|uniref:Major facilitator superfamily (MFS) profile domain-containing protein n=1 Tax=Arctia plantaginis TaxID=874455 RepID=A0A8S0ZJ28_ARCPL|nr:unnamed protein product [Arctia plantaginis]
MAPAHVYRQISATFASFLQSVTTGIIMGFTAVLLPQLEMDEYFTYDKNFDSWIAAISPLAMSIGGLFSGGLSDLIGRKMGQIILIIPSIIGWIIMGVSGNNLLMLIGRIVTGICAGASRSSTLVYVGEVTDPKYRPVAFITYSTGIQFGTLVSHTVGKYCNWKTSCYLFAIPNFISLIILVFLKESPLWLLAKSRIDEGVKCFRLFRGNGESSHKELCTVLETCQGKPKKTSFRDVLDLIFSKPFIKSVFTTFVIFAAAQWCGVNTLSFYAQQIFEKTFSSNIDPFLFMVATDCLRTVMTVIYCVLSKTVPRKITYVVCCFVTTLLLLVILAYLLLRPVGLESLAVTATIAYLCASGALPAISWSFVAEIFPVAVRGFGSGLSTCVCCVLLSISVKVTPAVIVNYGMTTLFGGFATVSLVTGILLIFLLPETNGKSLQEIENSLYKKKNIVQDNFEVVGVLSKYSGQLSIRNDL